MIPFERAVIQSMNHRIQRRVWKGTEGRENFDFCVLRNSVLKQWAAGRMARFLAPMLVHRWRSKLSMKLPGSRTELPIRFAFWLTTTAYSCRDERPSLMVE